MIGILLSMLVSVAGAAQFSFEVPVAGEPSEIIQAVESLGIMVMARSESDTVDGYVIIQSRKDGSAHVTVHLYEKAKGQSGKKVGRRAHIFRKDKQAKSKLKGKIQGAGK